MMSNELILRIGFNAHYVPAHDEQVLCCLNISSWSGCNSLSWMNNSLFRALLSKTTSKLSIGHPRTEPAFFISLFSFIVSLSLKLSPQKMAKKKTALAITPSDEDEDFQHLAANMKGPELPQTIKFAYPIPVHRLGLRWTPRYLQVLASSSTSYPISFIGLVVVLFLPTLTTIFLVLAILRNGWFFPHHSTKLFTRSLYSSYCTFLIHLTTTQLLDNFFMWQRSDLYWKSLVYRQRNRDSRIPCDALVMLCSDSDKQLPRQSSWGLSDRLSVCNPGDDGGVDLHSTHLLT